MDLELLAYGVVQAGCAAIVDRPGTDPDEVTVALVEFVVGYTGVSRPDAARALLKAAEKVRGGSCN